MQQLGKPRGVAFVIVLTIVTLGIYGLYWLWVTFAEIKRWRAQGVGGFVGLLLTIVIVGVFLLPSYVGRMYKEDLIARGEDPLHAAKQVPITGWSGFLHLIPWIGGLIWIGKVQSKLNNFWEGQEIRSAAGTQAASG
jgi:uncharacterized membrane protein YhaH (DUF805 family)